MISDLATKLFEELKNAVPHIQRMDDAQAKADAAKSLLTSTNTDLESAKAELKKVQSEIGAANETLKSKKHQINDEALRSLQEVQGQIKDAQAKLAALGEAIGKKQATHDEIVKSMNALVGRLDLRE